MEGPSREGGGGKWVEPQQYFAKTGDERAVTGRLPHSPWGSILIVHVPTTICSDTCQYDKQR